MGIGRAIRCTVSMTRHDLSQARSTRKQGLYFALCWRSDTHRFLPYHTVFLQSLFSGASGLGQMAVGELGTSGKQGQERRETRSHCVPANKSEKNFKIKNLKNRREAGIDQMQNLLWTDLWTTLSEEEGKINKYTTHKRKSKGHTRKIKKHAERVTDSDVERGRSSKETPSRGFFIDSVLVLEILTIDRAWKSSARKVAGDKLSGTSPNEHHTHIECLRYFAFRVPYTHLTGTAWIR